MSLTICLAHCMYPIEVETGIRTRLEERLETAGVRKLAVVTDATVWSLYQETLLPQLKGVEHQVTVLPPGERTKSHDSLMQLYREWLAFGLTRGDRVLALGGGVIGDLAGYAAATYLRGVPFIQMPTTLLSQIDSSIGGKVAVDLPEGKNLVGTFYHPEAVWIDPGFLNTLDPRVLRDGSAEAVKAGCIRDPELFKRMEDFRDPLPQELAEVIIHRALTVKKALVEADEKEMGLRKLLNFGHTIGHALEAYGDYSRWTHGEAVSMGMVWMTRATERAGLTEAGSTDRLRELLHCIGLPVEAGVPLDPLLPWLLRDKKKTPRGIQLVVIRKIGDGTLHEVSQDALQEFLELEG